MAINKFKTSYKSDKHNQDMVMSKCFSDIGYVMRVHVGNKKAAFYSSAVSFCYFAGLSGVAQFIRSNFLRPVTTEHEWILVKLYGSRIGLTDV